MYQENLPKRLRKAREDAGYTQQAVEDATGIKRQNISKYETGALDLSTEALGTLAQFYNVSVDWLLGVVVQPEPKPEKKSRSEKAV